MIRLKRNWEIDELIEHFTFLPHELKLIINKTGATRLGFAVLFKFFQLEARFPTNKTEIPNVIIEYISKQTDSDPSLFNSYTWTDRKGKYHKAQIRDYFGFSGTTVAVTEQVTAWLNSHINHHNADYEYLKDVAYKKFRELKVEPPTVDRIDRIIKSVVYKYETGFFQETFYKIPQRTLSKIDILINDLTSQEELELQDDSSLSFSELRADPGRISLESVFSELKKLRTLQELNLPNDLFSGIPNKTLKKYKQRAVSEDIRELRRHPEEIRYTLLSVFFWLRKMETTDNIMELLIQIIHIWRLKRTM